MEPSRNQGVNLLRPDSISDRPNSSIHPRSTYRRVPSLDADFDNDISRQTPSHSDPPQLPEISDLGQASSVGLGIQDPEGPLLHRESVHSRHTRPLSDPFGDGPDSAKESIELNDLERSQDYHFSESGSHVGSPPIVVTPGDETYGHSGTVNCPSRRSVTQRRMSWLSLSILVLAFYSTAFSGIYLVVAFVEPRFGRRIGSDGGMSASTASILSAFFAKTIELSFVTVFVAFLGQVLSRRTLSKKSTGISIADMSMRSWIMQPGTMITHWENIKYSGLTYLGMISLTAAFMGLLYTTAAETLVSPKLRYGSPEEKMLSGQVHTKFANPKYLAQQCQTPIPHDMDPEAGPTTCLQMAHVGQAYHNYQQYIDRWGGLVDRGQDKAKKLEHRPPPVGNWYDNTTVTGRWIEVQDMSEASKKHGRMINNITAAMPHAGVFSSSRDPANDLRQPRDLGGRGEFNISASVPSPIVNVLCAGMTKEELKPILYTEWPNPKHKFVPANWIQATPDDIPGPPGSWVNKTVVDDIFGFGREKGQQAPVFPKVPEEYQTMLNATGDWPTNAIYVLGASPPSTPDPPFVLCALKGGLTSKCSTEYHAAASGGKLDANCDDDNPLAYRHKAPKAPSVTYDADWKNVASEWAKAVSLGDGLANGKSANARLLTQFIPHFDKKKKQYSLSPHLPSISEALATMAGSTLLLSTEGAQLQHGWPYEGTAVPPDGKSVYQSYSAKLTTSDYASGSTQRWQKSFFVVLVLVFVTNLICLIYMYLEIRGVQLTDFTEPQNAFALALNSPPSTRVSGACGGGPEGQQLKEKWVISMDESDEHYYITNSAEHADVLRARMLRNRRTSPNGNPALSPAVTEYRRLSSTKSSLSLLR